MNEYRRFLKEDLKKIREAYEEARKGYTYFQDKIAAEKKRWESELRRGWPTVAERQADTAAHEKTMSELKKSLAYVISKSKEEFAIIKADACAVFDKYYAPSPERMDANAIELLKSGILSVDEIKALAERYADNNTMRRIIGKHLEEAGTKNNDTKARIYGMELQSATMPHREAIDTLVYWSEQALRDDQCLADGIAKVYDEQADRITAEYESVSVPAEVPGNNK